MMMLAMLLWISLLLGQFGAIPLDDGVILYVQDIALLLIIFLTIIRNGLLRKLWTLRLMRPIALFTALGIVSLITNYSQYSPWVIGKGSLYLIRWIAYAIFYGVIVVSPYSTRFWLVWLGSFGVVLAAGGLVQFVWYPDLRNLWYLGWDPHYYRVFATLLDPNYIGILLVLTIYVLLYLYIQATRWRFLIMFLLGIVGIVLLLTYSRSSYLALLGGVGVAITLLKRVKEGVFIALLFLLVVVYVPKPGGDTLALDRFDSTAARVQNWTQTVGRIGERPVFGYGFNVVPFLEKREASSLPGRRGAGIDSSILFVAVTTGIVGLAGYLWLMVAQMNLANRSTDRVLNVLFVASFTAIGVHSLFVNSLFYPWVMIWLWTLAGVVEKTHHNNIKV